MVLLATYAVIYKNYCVQINSEKGPRAHGIDIVKDIPKTTVFRIILRRVPEPKLLILLEAFFDLHL